AVGPRPLGYALARGKRLGGRHARIALAEGLADRHATGHTPAARCDGAIVSFLVEDETDQLDLLPILRQRPAHDLVGIGKLGDGPRMDEARRLDGGQAGPRQRRDEFQLFVGAEMRRLVLQSVAGANLIDTDGVAHDAAPGDWLGVTVAFRGARPSGGRRPYPAPLCSARREE